MQNNLIQYLEQIKIKTGAKGIYEAFLVSVNKNIEEQKDKIKQLKSQSKITKEKFEKLKEKLSAQNKRGITEEILKLEKRIDQIRIETKNATQNNYGQENIQENAPPLLSNNTFLELLKNDQLIIATTFNKNQEFEISNSLRDTQEKLESEKKNVGIEKTKFKEKILRIQNSQQINQGNTEFQKIISEIENIESEYNLKIKEINLFINELKLKFKDLIRVDQNYKRLKNKLKDITDDFERIIIFASNLQTQEYDEQLQDLEEKLTDIKSNLENKEQELIKQEQNFQLQVIALQQMEQQCSNLRSQTESFENIQVKNLQQIDEQRISINQLKEQNDDLENEFKEPYNKYMQALQENNIQSIEFVKKYRNSQEQ